MNTEHELIARLDAKRILALPTVEEQVREMQFFAQIASPELLDAMYRNRDVRVWVLSEPVRMEIERLEAARAAE